MEMERMILVEMEKRGEWSEREEKLVLERMRD
jgi:hypothetical protein